MKLQLSKNSWHYKLNEFAGDGVSSDVNFCGYFWTTIFLLLTLPMSTPFILLKRVQKKLKKSIRDLEVKMASPADLLIAYKDYQDKRNKKWNYMLWDSYAERNNLDYYPKIYNTGKKTINFIADLEKTVANQAKASGKPAPTKYVKGHYYAYLIDLVDFLYPALSLFMGLSTISIVGGFFGLSGSLAAFKIFFSVLISLLLIYNIVRLVKLSYDIYKYGGRKDKVDDSLDRIRDALTIKQKPNYNNFFSFFKKGFKSFKEKTCHKIEWTK